MKKYFRVIGFLIILLSAGYIFLVRTVMPQYIRQLLPQAEQAAAGYINGSVSIGSLSWSGGLSAEIDNIVVRDANGGPVAELPRTIVHFRPWLALDKGARALSRVELMRPRAYLTMDENRRWNMQHLLKPSDSEETPFYGLLEITDGKLLLTTPQGGWELGVGGTVGGGANPKFAVDLQLTSGSDRLRLGGLVTTRGEGRLELRSDGLSLEQYAPLAEHYAGISALQGGLGRLALLYVNEKGRHAFSGEAALAALQGKMAAGADQHSLRLDGLVRVTDNIVAVKELQAHLDGQLLRLEGEADLRDSSNPKGSGVLSAETLEYGGYKLQNLRLPLRGSSETIVLEGVSLEYGGGRVSGSAAYSVPEQELTADLELQGITHRMPDRPGEDVQLDARLAVTAKNLDERLQLRAAADTMDLRWQGLRIKKMAFDGALTGDGLQVEHFSAFSGDNGCLLASGSVDGEGRLDLRGRMADFPITPVLSLAGFEGSGLCSTGFAVGGRLGAPEFAGIVQLSGAELMQQHIKEGHGFVDLKDNVLTVSNFTLQMEQGEHLASGSIDLRGAEPYMDLALESRGVRIEPLMKLIAADVSVTGNLYNVMQVRGTPANPYVYGEVHASDGSVAEQLFNSVDGRYVYENGQLELHNFLAKAFIASVRLDGIMTADRRLDFAMEAKKVDLGNLPVKDETVELDGLLDARGHLTGTLAKPAFSGDIASEKLLINGEALTELQGTLDSDGGEKNLFRVSFKQPYRDDPVEYGLFSADVNLNLLRHYWQGRVLMDWGDIGGLLRMARQDYDINGQARGELAINPHGQGSGINIDISADDVKLHALNYEHMNFNGRMQKGILYFDDVKLQEQKDTADRGIVALGGQIDLFGGSLNLELASIKANPAVAAVVMKDPPEIKGEMDILVQLYGSLDDLQGTGSLEIVNGSVAGVGMDRLVAMLSLEHDNIRLQQLLASRDAYAVSASGDIPLDIFRAAGQRRNPRAHMDIIMNLDEARLGVLPAMTPLAEWGVGETRGKVRLAGTLEEPLLFGSLKVTEGAVKLRHLDTVLENINLDVDFQGNNILLRDISAKLGKGTLSAQGSYALHTDADTAYSLKIKADNAELVSQLFTGRINSEIEIVPQRYRDYREHNGNELPPEEYRPLIKGQLALEDVLVNMPTVPEIGEGTSNLGLDVKVDLGKKIHLYNSYLYDIWLSGGIHVKGSTLWPLVDGSIKADKGVITYLRTDFKLDNAKLMWTDPGSFLPSVSLDSRARFSRYRIFMKVNGPVEGMEMQLSSDPPLERNTIVRMLTLQREEAGSNEITGEDVTNLMTVGLQMTVLGDVETFVKQTLGLDQFRIYTGRVRSGVGFESYRNTLETLTAEERNQYNVLVSKYLNDKFMIGYTTSFDALDRSIFGQYDISRHMNITYSRSYDMSADTDEWFGLEYKISF